MPRPIPRIIPYSVGFDRDGASNIRGHIGCLCMWQQSRNIEVYATKNLFIDLHRMRCEVARARPTSSPPENNYESVWEPLR